VILTPRYGGIKFWNGDENLRPVYKIPL
jgi:hypothetical protein